MLVNLREGSKFLSILSVPNRPVRTPGPWRPIVPSVPGRVGKDGWARRPSFVNTPGLWVDGRALQSFL